MRVPDVLLSLLDYGVIDEVVRPLMSGKEAQIYLVVSEGEWRVAKVYKEARDRTFRHRAAYAEGRKTRNTRDQRAMNKRSRHGKAQDEAAWRSTEVEMIYRLHAAGVRVPTPYQFVDGVLIMELITDAGGEPAPRLGELELYPEEAVAIHDWMLGQVVRMLCAGVVHGDLSDFNILMDADGPVIIDFPQAVDPASNQNARRLLLRDVDNLHRFLAHFVPDAPRLPYGEEMWALYGLNQLTPDTPLTGHYQERGGRADVAAVLELIEDADADERRRRTSLGLRGGPRAAERARAERPAERGRAERPAERARAERPTEASAPAHEGAAPRATAAARRRRRRRKGPPPPK